MIAEYLVRCAIEVEPGPVLEWDGVDIRTPTGTIEVKSASALSGGPVRKVVQPRFGIQMSGMPWEAVNNVWGSHDGTRRHADVYVFCLHAATDPVTADSLDVAQWQFWVLRSGVIDRELGLVPDRCQSAVSTRLGST